MSPVRLFLIAVGCCLALPLPGQALGRDQAPVPPPPPAFGWPEARGFLGVAALGGLAYLADTPVREALRAADGSGDGVAEALSQVGYYYGQPGVAILAAGMWGSGLLASKPTLAASGLRAMEAIAISGAVTVLVKELTGRARPDVPPNRRDNWSASRTFAGGGSDYHSMASGHATVVFAFATAVTQAVAERRPEYARTVAIGSFGLAGLTAWQRIYDDRHWLSDVIVGAGIGTVTALAITKWHRARPDNAIDRLFLRPVLAPAHGGLRVGLEVQWP